MSCTALSSRRKGSRATETFNLCQASAGSSRRTYSPKVRSLASLIDRPESVGFLAPRMLSIEKLLATKTRSRFSICPNKRNGSLRLRNWRLRSATVTMPWKVRSVLRTSTNPPATILGITSNRAAFDQTSSAATMQSLTAEAVSLLHVERDRDRADSIRAREPGDVQERYAVRCDVGRWRVAPDFEDVCELGAHAADRAAFDAEAEHPRGGRSANVASLLLAIARSNGAAPARRSFGPP